MESLEISQVLLFQKISFLSIIIFALGTIILFFMNMFLSEKVRVNLSKQVKKEKITFSNEDIDINISSQSKENLNTKESLKIQDSLNLSDLSNTKSKTDKRKTSSIFDLKDL